MQGLKKRLMVSAVLITIVLITIYALPHWLFFCVVEAFILLALNEYLLLAERKGIVINRVLGLFFGALLPFSIYFSSDAMVLAIACLAVFVSNFHPKYRAQALLSTSVTVFGIIYVAWFFSFMNKIRYLEHGGSWVLFLLLCIKGGDAGAYFVGKSIGKTKLIEHVSPNKSVEGAVGGLITSIALAALSKLYLVHIPMAHLLVLGAILGVLSQIGDLAESLIKRDVGVKDSGQIPGLGGILDVLDSLLLCVPCLYYYITMFPGLT